MKNNTWNIIKKECSRFFGDRTMVITTIIMPGLLIFLIYSMMGDFFMKQKENAAPTKVYVENLSDSLKPILSTLPFEMITENLNGENLKSDLSKKEQDYIYMVFPDDFDSLVSISPSERTELAPNVQIYYNSTSDKSKEAYNVLSEVLGQWEDSNYNLFDINKIEKEGQAYDLASTEDVVRGMFSELIPFLLLMMIFSGCMSIVPTSIAGEKERGTLATLLVTPLKRSELALGKVLSVTFFTVLSGLSAFLGMMLSLPKLIHADEMGVDAAIYTTNDYVALLVIILCTVIILTSAASIISAKANSIKAASSLMLPFMLVILFIGLTPMMLETSDSSIALFLIPVYNSVQSMTQILGHEINIIPIILTVVSNFLYSVLCIWILTKMFNSERVMFSK